MSDPKLAEEFQQLTWDGPGSPPLKTVVRWLNEHGYAVVPFDMLSTVQTKEML